MKVWLPDRVSMPLCAVDYALSTCQLSRQDIFGSVTAYQIRNRECSGNKNVAANPSPTVEPIHPVRHQVRYQVGYPVGYQYFLNRV
jgi:hypothetical protein